MKLILRAALAATSAMFAASAALAGDLVISPDTGQVTVNVAPGVLVHRAPAKDFKPTAAYEWLDILLEASGRDAVKNKPRPTVLSRADAIVLTAMYDAWAAYDDKALGTRLGAQLRRPEAERTDANKATAIGQAAVKALLFVFPEDAEWIKAKAKAKKLNPDDMSVDPKTPAGVGNAAAAALIEFRKHDGSNQAGDYPTGNGKPYSDTTSYKPQDAGGADFDWTRWQPIPFSDGKGGSVTPGYLTAHWGTVTPVMLERADMFRPPAPPKWGSERLNRDIEEAAHVNANLTLEQKAIVEFMREGPRSTGQSGHWLQFAQDVSRRDRNTLDQDVKLFMAVSNVIMDAFIACWETKRFYDTGRPYWWVRQYYKGKQIPAWLGPGKGFGTLAGETWLPYSPDTFITPPFPGYVSGHATASAAASRTLELITGSDRFGAEAYQFAGQLTGEANFTSAQMQANAAVGAAMPVPVEVKGATQDPKVIHLTLPSFTATAEMAAVSRLWGGFHIRTDNEEGLILGRKIAMYSWPKYQALFNGK